MIFQSDYSWSDVANVLSDYNIPHGVIRGLQDVQMSVILHRPVLNILKFDDYLHDQYGDYESEGKSMSDLFNKIFGENAELVAYYFGIE